MKLSYSPVVFLTLLILDSSNALFITPSPPTPASTISLSSHTTPIPSSIPKSTPKPIPTAVQAASKVKALEANRITNPPSVQNAQAEEDDRWYYITTYYSCVDWESGYRHCGIHEKVRPKGAGVKAAGGSGGEGWRAIVVAGAGGLFLGGMLR